MSRIPPAQNDHPAVVPRGSRFATCLLSSSLSPYVPSWWSIPPGVSRSPICGKGSRAAPTKTSTKPAAANAVCLLAPSPEPSPRRPPAGAVVPLLQRPLQFQGRSDRLVVPTRATRGLISPGAHRRARRKGYQLFASVLAPPQREGQWPAFSRFGPGHHGSASTSRMPVQLSRSARPQGGATCHHVTGLDGVIKTSLLLPLPASLRLERR
ncbi:hypothetical protein BKP43_64200 [Variovorax boronicumulans]|nr:hypothetical protein BKP43_64200 [Variovorax boronicumulans]